MNNYGKTIKNYLIKKYGIDLSKGNHGLGPNSWGWYRILLPYQKRFSYPSYVHDKKYTHNVGLIRKNIDKEFYIDCKSRCRSLISKTFALLYYILLRMFGFIYFNKTKGHHIKTQI